MQTAGKFVIQLTGPIVKYRLDILAKVCPEIRHFLICLTNQESYDLYKEYHGFFEFVILDEYRKEYSFSLAHEQFPSYKTEQEFFANIGSFYGGHSNRFYPYDIHRFIFPYMIEHNILNFALSDTDVIVRNDAQLLNTFFENIPSGTLYGPWHDKDISSRQLKKEFWEELQPQFPSLKLDAPFLRTQDGWMRGFHFKNVEDMKLVFDLWNAALELLFENAKYRQQLLGHNGTIAQTEWVISHIIQFLEYNRGYKYKDCFEVLQVDSKQIGVHRTRVEDTIYLGKRLGWEYLNLDYSDTTSIAAFIKNNKDPLKKYYDGTFHAEVTDTHVFTTYGNPI